MNQKLYKLHELYKKHQPTQLYSSPKLDARFAETQPGTQPPRIGQCSCGLWLWSRGGQPEQLHGTLAGWIAAENPAIAPKLRAWYTRVAKRLGIPYVETWRRVQAQANKCREIP